MKKSIILLLVMTSLIVSCDLIYRAEIKNETDYPIFIEIKFDTVGLNKYSGDKSYLRELYLYPNFRGISAIDFDSIKLIKTFIIKPNESFPLESSLMHPQYDVFENLTVIAKDTLQLTSKQEIQKAFVRTDHYTWELLIK